MKHIKLNHYNASSNLIDWILKQRGKWPKCPSEGCPLCLLQIMDEKLSEYEYTLEQIAAGKVSARKAARKALKVK